MNKLQHIQNIMPDFAKIQIKSYDKTKWFVSYRYDVNEHQEQIIYQTFTTNLDDTLQNVINLIMEKEGVK